MSDSLPTDAPPSASPAEGEAKRLGLGKLLSLLLCVALLIQFAPAYVAPRLALERAQVADAAYRHLNTYGRDPWGHHFRWSSWWNSTERYSRGPNGIDESGQGDDMKLRPWASLGAPWIAFLFLLWCLPFGLCATAWILVVRKARRAKDRALGWRELGWASLTGGPLAVFAAGFGWWGSGNWTWRNLLVGHGGLLGWRLSMTGSVVAALFVAGWALSRPPREREGWPDAEAPPEPESEPAPEASHEPEAETEGEAS